MKNKNDRRRPRGARNTERGTLVRMSLDLLGMVLSRAFVVAKSAGFRLVVNKLDGIPLCVASVIDGPKVIRVDVVDGLVKRGWFSTDD